MLVVLSVVGALLTGCGGDSLTYEESMALLASAGEKAVAAAYSIENTNISVVETEDSPKERHLVRSRSSCNGTGIRGSPRTQTKSLSIVDRLYVQSTST